MTHAFPACVFASRQRLVHDTFGELLDTVLAGRTFTDRATEERLVAALAAAQRVSELHTIDSRGRCTICWRGAYGWWPARLSHRTCTVYDTFGAYLSRPSALDD